MNRKKRNTEVVHIWGVKFNLLDLKGFIRRISLLIDNNLVPIHITGIGPETVVHASRDRIVSESINQSSLTNIDNIFIVIILRLLGYKVPSRVATPDLFEQLLMLAAKRNLKVFILGAKKDILENAIGNIKKDYPNLIIEGQHGYYDRNRETEIINKINDFSTDMLFIAFPSPEKESFILKYKNIINAKLFLGIGGAVDCRAGVVKRGPRFLRNNGFEGIARTLQSPMNYGIRYFKFYPTFLGIVIKSIFKNQNHK